MKLHPSITQERIIAAVESSLMDTEQPGFCIDCGADQSPVEPDAKNYVCETCGARSVFGAEQIMLEVMS